MLAALILAAAVAHAPPPQGGRCFESELSVGDTFVPMGGTTKTVEQIARMRFGFDTIGYVYQATDKSLFAQARSGMPREMQNAAQFPMILAPHVIGQPYRYSAIIPLKSGIYRAAIEFCRNKQYWPQP